MKLKVKSQKLKFRIQKGACPERIRLWRGVEGASLIELVVYVAIFVVIVTLLSEIFVLFQTSLARNRLSSEVLANGSFISEGISRQIRQAAGINTAAGSTLSLQMADSSLDPTVFALSVTDLTLQQGAGLAEPLNSAQVKLTNLDFSQVNNLGGPVAVSFRFEIVAQKPGTNLKANQSFEGAVSLRP